MSGWNHPEPCARCGILRRRRSHDSAMCAACREIPSMDMPRWTEYAACKNPAYDPDWWWPEKADLDERTKIAVAICRTCKVRDLCLDYAIQHREVHGIWGALMPAARNAIAAQRRRRAI